MKLSFYYKVVLSILFIYIFSGCSNQPNEEKQINVVFRFDDPSALSSTEIELKVIDAFREHNASLTFGVIPFKCAGSTRDTSPQDVVPLGAKKGELLRNAVEEGIVDIALHGYSHQMREAEVWTEFWGMDYDSQFDKLSKGKELLEGTIGKPVTTFIPPYNTYDRNTLKVLEALDFSILSAGIHGDVSPDSKLNFMPMTIRLHQLHKAVKQARASSDSQPLIVVMFHEYDFMDAKVKGINKRIITFEELNNHLDWLKSQKDTRILSISQANKEIRDLSAKRLQLSYLYSFFKPIVPSFLRESTSVYPESSPLLKTTVVKIILLYLLSIALGVVFSYVLGCLLLQRSAKIMKITTFTNTIITAAFILYVIRDLEVHIKGMVVMTLLIGTSIGLWICYYNAKKRSG